MTDTVISVHSESTVALDLELLKQRALGILDAMGVSGAEVCILATDDAAIRALNREWREVDSPTDVLSFPMTEDEGGEVVPGYPRRLLGDIAISLETANRAVTSEGHRGRVAESLGEQPETLLWELADEVTFLLIHGLLHLLGHDHASAEEESEMRRQESELMRPYLSRDGALTE